MAADVTPTPALDTELEELLAERAITRVIHRYARGADRHDFELVRSCYWPDATDDHGMYKGGVDGFIDYVSTVTSKFDSTNHHLGQTLVEVDLERDVARAETYVVAYHRISQDDGTKVDMVSGLRYVDRFERRDGEWRIAKRVCAFDWQRSDPVVGRSGFHPDFVRGTRDADDILWHILD